MRILPTIIKRKGRLPQEILSSAIAAYKPSTKEIWLSSDVTLKNLFHELLHWLFDLIHFKIGHWLLDGRWKPL